MTCAVLTSAALAVWAPGVVAQQGGAVAAGDTLSLERALRLAEQNSEQVAIAQAGVMRAHGQQLQARSEYFPQVSGSASFTRTLATEFSSLQSEPDTTTGPPVPDNCGRGFLPDPSLPLEQRVDSLEHALQCAVNTNPFSAFRNLPFGRKNQLNLGLSVSQTLFSGGRVRAQNRVAEAGRRTAEIALNSSRAQLVLDVTQAYYDAALSDRLLAISEATLDQAQRTLSQVTLAKEVGTQPEFELLRAQVTAQTQRPVVIQRRSDRELAYLRLKQLLNLTLDAPLHLTTTLEDAELEPVVEVASRVLDVSLDTAVEARAPVRQAAAAVRVQEGQVSVARAQRWPTLTLSSSYGRVAYPENGFPDWNDFRSNWTITASTTLPLFTGGRIRGDQMVAEASLAEARARLEQTRELAVLDTRSVFEEMQAAQATWQASSGTVEQAQQAYDIAEVRYNEGISTQLELNDSRIVMQQARANRAQAARDLQVARMRIALLPWLPLASGSQAGGQLRQGQTPIQALPQGGTQPGTGQSATQAGTVRTAAQTNNQRR